MMTISQATAQNGENVLSSQLSMAAVSEVKSYIQRFEAGNWNGQGGRDVEITP